MFIGAYLFILLLFIHFKASTANIAQFVRGYTSHECSPSLLYPLFPQDVQKIYCKQFQIRETYLKAEQIFVSHLNKDDKRNVRSPNKEKHLNIITRLQCKSSISVCTWNTGHQLLLPQLSWDCETLSNTKVQGVLNERHCIPIICL